MVRNDRRTPAQRATHRYLVVMTDRFMSGWGAARNGTSVAAWACECLTDAHKVEANVRARGDALRVRIVYDSPKRAYRPRNAAHLSVYVVEPDDRALTGFV